MLSAELKKEIHDRWDARARTYDKSPGHGIHSDLEKKAWLDILSCALDHRKGLKVLDVGTGTGALALLLAELGHDATGIDLSENMLEKAGKKAREKGLKAVFRTGDAESPPFNPGSFDAIVSRHVLWTLPNPEVAIKSWAGLLKPGGAIVVIDGNFSMKNRSLGQKAWRLAAMPLILVTEFRDPRMGNLDMNGQLPMRKRRRPDADLSLLRAEGFEASVSDQVIPRRYSLLNYLKYGHGKQSMHQFVVKGVKPQ